MTSTLKRDLNLQFEEKVDESGSFGTLIIKGISFPDDNILPKFASSWRKRTFEKHCIRASATFIYKNEGNVPVVVCSFYLDYVNVNSVGDRYTVEERFKDFFPELVALFEEIVETFLFDFEDGYVPYKKYVGSKDACEEISNKMLDNFLRKFNFKTIDDDENKLKFQKGIQELVQMLNFDPKSFDEKKD